VPERWDILDGPHEIFRSIFGTHTGVMAITVLMLDRSYIGRVSFLQHKNEMKVSMGLVAEIWSGYHQ
jgi:hypothetical protein